MTDHDLLRQYAMDRSESAFAELVRRHGGWVRASAARQVRDTHLAEDVAQAAFIVLAKKARSIGGRRTALAPWLFAVVRLVANRALRDERRRRRHERLAAEQRMAEGPGAGPADAALSAGEWSRVAAVVDDAVARLRPTDRDAILLRFYRRTPYAELGAALGGVSEEAARKRVGRAVDRLRERLAGRGVEVELAALLPALWQFTAPPAEAIPPPMAGAAAVGRPLQLAKGAMHMARLSAMTVPAACAAVVAAAVVAMNDAPPPEPAGPAAPVTTRLAAAPLPADQPAPPAPPQPSALDRPVPGIRGETPAAADDIVEMLQDMTGVAITVEWEKLGTRGDKGITLNLQPMPLRDMINAILKAAGATKPAAMTVENKVLLVTAAVEPEKK